MRAVSIKAPTYISADSAIYKSVKNLTGRAIYETVVNPVYKFFVLDVNESTRAAIWSSVDYAMHFVDDSVDRAMIEYEY